jgi:hypothetical protein
MVFGQRESVWTQVRKPWETLEVSKSGSVG